MLLSAVLSERWEDFRVGFGVPTADGRDSAPPYQSPILVGNWSRIGFKVVQEFPIHSKALSLRSRVVVNPFRIWAAPKN